MLTNYHAKLYAYELTKRCPSDSVEKFTATLMDSQVDLTPHQVDAALFAFRSPLSKGAILADEVGLGKTIEGGIVRREQDAAEFLGVVTPLNRRMCIRSRDGQTGINMTKFAVALTATDVEQIALLTPSGWFHIENLTESRPQTRTVQTVNLHILPIENQIFDLVLELFWRECAVLTAGLPNHEQNG